MKLRWVGKNNRKVLDYIHRPECSDYACIGCFGDGKWDYPERRSFDPILKIDALLQDACERQKHAVLNQVRKSKSRKITDYQHHIDALAAWFHEQMQTHAEHQRKRRVSSGTLLPGNASVGDLERLADIAAKGSVLRWIHRYDQSISRKPMNA